jgi:VWFA-related protein
MRPRLQRPSLGLAILLILFLTHPDYRSITTAVLAQSSTQEKPKLRDFGSSLDRLKWDPKKRAAVETRSANDKREGGAPEDVITVETRLVLCDVSVLDRKGRNISALTQSDFIITDNGQPQQISHFSLGSDQGLPRSIVLIIDYSGSELPYIDDSIDAAKALVDKLRPRDRLAIVTDDVELLADFSADKMALKSALESVRQRTARHHFGRSQQFSALMATVREMFSAEDIRPIIIFQTDGDELSFLKPYDLSLFLSIANLPGGSKLRQTPFKEFSLNDVYTAAEKSRATIYTVIPNTRLLGVAPAEQLKRVQTMMTTRNPRIYLDGHVLANYADNLVRQQTAAAGAAVVTGGWTVFLERPDQAATLYAAILADVNSRYLIGYYPTNKLYDGKRHKVLIEVRDHPEYSIEGRKFYYAPGPEE